jgi:hypothetical protein
LPRPSTIMRRRAPQRWDQCSRRAAGNHRGGGRATVRGLDERSQSLATTRVQLRNWRLTTEASSVMAQVVREWP